MYNKQKFLNLIHSNIQEYEFHITTVNSNTEPRFAYTIGLTNLFNFELVFTGGIIFLKDELSLIFHTIVNELKKDQNIITRKIKVDTLGTFSLSAVDSSWSKMLMLGVFDYYKTVKITAFQIVPDAAHHTLDIPDMSKEFNGKSAPVWQWLNREWDYAFPKNSTVATNIESLLGETITELTRWEDDYWEMFAGAGPDVTKEETRIVSLATMLAIDPTILPAINLEIGKGLWRDDSGSIWNSWG